MGAPFNAPVQGVGVDDDPEAVEAGPCDHDATWIFFCTNNSIYLSSMNWRRVAKVLAVSSFALNSVHSCFC